jgi:Ca2+-binding EF-hand superfamily protein
MDNDEGDVPVMLDKQVSLRPITTPAVMSLGPSIEPSPNISPPNVGSSAHTSPRGSTKVQESSVPSYMPSPKSARDAGRSMRSTMGSPVPLTSKEAAMETRKDVITYIRNERDTAQVKWMQLTENMNTEDRKRDEFIAGRLKATHRTLPIQVKKLIGNLKRAVHKTMASVGGTPFSILRQLFIYWDRNNNGSLSFTDFSSALKSLQIEIPRQDLQDIFAFYAHSSGTNGRMGYHELLSDIQLGEPTILDFLGDRVNSMDTHELRFEEAGDKFAERPKKVTLFIEAIRNHIMEKMRVEGGTLEYHVRKMFQSFDFNYSSALDPDELLAAGTGLFHLKMTKEDAQMIVRYFDRRKTGEMCANLFVEAVCEGQTSLLSFTETTKEMRATEKKKIKENPFVKTEFRPTPNKLFQRVKEKIRSTLDVRLNRKGGSYSSWVTEAFSFWDPKGTGIFSHWQHLQGAILRLGVHITQDEAAAVLACFDEHKNGQVRYKNIIRNILEDETNLIVPSHPKNENALSNRAPKAVDLFTRKIKTAIDIFVKKSKGSLDPRDVLHGTFLRFDAGQTGRVSKEDFVQVAKELGVTVSESQASVIVQWFDSNGFGSVDYNELTRQLYGEDQFQASTQMSFSQQGERTEKPRNSSAPSSSLLFAGTAFTSHPQVSKNPILSFVSPESISFDSFGVTSCPPARNPLSASLSSTLITKFGIMDGNHWQTTTKAPLAADKKLMIETHLIKQARKKIRKNVILQERAKVVGKIEYIEQQRRTIIENHKIRVAERLKKQHKEEWELKVNGRAPEE